MVAVGYLLFALLAVGVCGGTVYLTLALPQEPEVPIIASLHAPTPTPHIPVNYPAGSHSIFKDDFTDNNNRWGDDQQPTQLSVDNGKLSFGAVSQGRYATAIAGKPGHFNQPYYLQADLSTDKGTDEDFGIIFEEQINGLGRDDFFLYSIDPKSKEYSLDHRFPDGWSWRMGGTSDLIHSFPAVNTLGLYVNQGYVEFYINHHMVNTYQDAGESFQSGETGFYVNNSGFQLIVTNFSVDQIEGQ